MSSVEQETDGGEPPIPLIDEVSTLIEAHFQATSNFQQNLHNIARIVEQVGIPLPSQQDTNARKLLTPDGLFTAELNHFFDRQIAILPNMSLSKKHPNTPNTSAGVYENPTAATIRTFWDGGITIDVDATVFPQAELFEEPVGSKAFMIRRDNRRVFIYSGIENLGRNTREFLAKLTYDAHESFHTIAQLL